VAAPAPEFDAVIHAPQRLQICALLARAGEVEFGTLRDALDVSDATLSKHLKTLQEAGVVETRRVQRLRGQARTWVELTKDGRHRLAAHFAFLRGLDPTAPTS
jgi:DNA-binding transcriptional ArsR family regulator